MLIAHPARLPDLAVYLRLQCLPPPRVLSLLDLSHPGVCSPNSGSDLPRALQCCGIAQSCARRLQKGLYLVRAIGSVWLDVRVVRSGL
jgi:hypothetical protein